MAKRVKVAWLFHLKTYIFKLKMHVFRLKTDFSAGNPAVVHAKQPENETAVSASGTRRIQDDDRSYHWRNRSRIPTTGMI